MDFLRILGTRLYRRIFSVHSWLGSSWDSIEDKLESMLWEVFGIKTRILISCKKLNHPSAPFQANLFNFSLMNRFGFYPAEVCFLSLKILSIDSSWNYLNDLMLSIMSLPGLYFLNHFHKKKSQNSFFHSRKHTEIFSHIYFA